MLNDLIDVDVVSKLLKGMISLKESKCMLVTQWDSQLEHIKENNNAIYFTYHGNGLFMFTKVDLKNGSSPLIKTV